MSHSSLINNFTFYLHIRVYCKLFKCHCILFCVVQEEAAFMKSRMAEMMTMMQEGKGRSKEGKNASFQNSVHGDEDDGDDEEDDEDGDDDGVVSVDNESDVDACFGNQHRVDSKTANKENVLNGEEDVEEVEEEDEVSNANDDSDFNEYSNDFEESFSSVQIHTDKLHSRSNAENITNSIPTFRSKVKNVEPTVNNKGYGKANGNSSGKHSPNRGNHSPMKHNSHAHANSPSDTRKRITLAGTTTMKGLRVKSTAATEGDGSHDYGIKNDLKKMKMKKMANATSKSNDKSTYSSEIASNPLFAFASKLETTPIPFGSGFGSSSRLGSTYPRQLYSERLHSLGVSAAGIGVDISDPILTSQVMIVSFVVSFFLDCLVLFCSNYIFKYEFFSWYNFVSARLCFVGNWMLYENV